MVDFSRAAVTTNLSGGESGGGIVEGEGADEGFLGRAAGDEPDGASVAQEGVGGGDAPNSKFGNEVRCEEEFFFLESDRFRKEGGGVAIVA